MNIGVSMVFSDDSPAHVIFSKITAAGFNQVELGCHDNSVGRWMHDTIGMKRLLAAAGLAARTAHSPSSGWNNDDPDDAVRRASVDAASSIFRAAAEAGVETVVVHPNTPGMRVFVEAEFETNFARSRDSVSTLAERAAEAGIRIALENVPRRGQARPGGPVEETLRLIDGLGDHVGVCFDVGHCNANAIDPVTEIHAAGSRIFCVHIQDNDGLGEDQHLIPGTGTVNWPAVIDALQRFAPQAVCNFEVGPKGGSVDELLAKLAAIRDGWLKG